MPDGTSPTFSREIRFASVPDPDQAQAVFAAGTEEVFAMWDYANMQDGLTVRREWYLDNELWLAREGKWDFELYGAAGTVTDISIFTFRGELEPGTYHLRLYIEDEPQFEPVDEPPAAHFFTVSGIGPLSPAVSPDGTRRALVQDGGTLILEEAGGERREIARTGEIGELAWFPDGQHVVYSDIDRSQIISGTFGIRSTLWVANVDSGEKYPISDPEEVLRAPAVAPDGRTIAVQTGSGWVDACLIDLGLAFIILDSNLQRLGMVLAHDFTGVAQSEDGGPFATYQRGLPVPGVWQDATTFEVGLTWICTGTDPSGIYRFDLSSQSADRIALLRR
jgi:hypothetical protein